MPYVIEVQAARQAEGRSWVKLSQHIVGCLPCTTKQVESKNGASTGCEYGKQLFTAYIEAHEHVGDVLDRIDAKLAPARQTVGK